MDYTTAANVKAALHASENTDDTLITQMVTRASRAIDRLCSGALAQGSDNYFEMGSATDEIIQGQVDRLGNLYCWPRKPVVTAVTAFSYRETPRENWQAVQAGDITLDGGAVMAWLELAGRGQLFVKISYSGGLAASVDALPADMVEAATILATRYYQEAQASYNDVIGVSDLGQVFFSKAIPQQVVSLLTPYKRVVRW